MSHMSPFGQIIGVYAGFSHPLKLPLINLRIELMRIEQKCLFLNNNFWKIKGGRPPLETAANMRARFIIMFIRVHSWNIIAALIFSIGIAKKYSRNSSKFIKMIDLSSGSLKYF